MATQRVLVVAVGGLLAETVWQSMHHWSTLRTSNSINEWALEDWPLLTRAEIDVFVTKISAAAFTPPILYRSEHVDCWSMGDIFQCAFKEINSDFLELHTTNHQVLAVWINSQKGLIPGTKVKPETIWFYNRLNEASNSWCELSKQRLIITVRTVLGGLWTDEEVKESLDTLPDWSEIRA